MKGNLLQNDMFNNIKLLVMLTVTKNCFPSSLWKTWTVLHKAVTSAPSNSLEMTWNTNCESVTAWALSFLLWLDGSKSLQPGLTFGRNPETTRVGKAIKVRDYGTWAGTDTVNITNGMFSRLERDPLFFFFLSCFYFRETFHVQGTLWRSWWLLVQ